MSLYTSLSPQALEDVFGIWGYIAAHDEAVADAFIERIFDVIHILEQHPQMGRLRVEFKRKPRSIAVESYNVFYRVLSSGRIIVIRILHGTRDIPPLFS